MHNWLPASHTQGDLQGKPPTSTPLVPNFQGEEAQSEDHPFCESAISPASPLDSAAHFQTLPIVCLDLYGKNHIKENPS